MEILLWAGKILLGGFFIMNGIEHFVHIKSHTAYAKHKKVPLAETAVYASGIVLLFGGFSILLGKMMVLGLSLLSVFLIVVTLQMHKFWLAKDPAEQMSEKIGFMKNVAILGALLMMLASLIK